MAGTLTVQNLQGPTTGANANKVILPAGHTLDTSSGTLVPSAGAVVQVESVQDSATSATSSAGAALTGATINFVPKFSTSKLLIIAKIPVKLNRVTSVTAAWASPFIEVNGARIDPKPSLDFELGINFGDTNWNDFRTVGYVQSLYEPASLPSSLSISIRAVSYASSQTLTVNESTLYKSYITVMEIAQ
jgi:hypothetical protein